MATAITWPIGTVLMFIWFGVVACSALGSTRRPGFYIRLGCATLVMVALALGLAFALTSSAPPQRAFGLVWVALLLAALAVAPVFCYRTLGHFPNSSDDDGGGGPGSDPPSPPPGPPHGGPPLADAEQARTRRRDHGPPSLRGVSRRRPAVEPPRRRTPSRPGP